MHHVLTSLFSVLLSHEGFALNSVLLFWIQKSTNMSNNKSSRHNSNSPSPIASNSPSSSKLPKFLQKSNRDRSKSVAESGSERPSPVDSPLPSPSSSKGPRKSSRFLNVGKKNDEDDDKDFDETPIIVEPGESSPAISIPRRRPERNDSVPQTSQSYTHTTSTSPRMSDLPTRLSGWFSHTFSTSSTDLSLPNLLNPHLHAQTNAASPKSKTSALLNVAKHGKGHLDKAMRYLLDSDATPDKCTDPIWLLGVEHKGYEPPPPIPPPHQIGEPPGPRASIDAKSKPPSSFRSSTGNKHKHSLSQSGNPLSQSQPPSSRGSPANSQSASLSSSVSSSTSLITPTQSATLNTKPPVVHWPAEFYSDFTSKVWVTYRSNFPPIRDTTLNDLPLPSEPAPSYVDTFKSDSSFSVRSIGSNTSINPPNPSPTGKKWSWGLPGLGSERERGWTNDSGWGCMLRTGQSLLANALVFMALGRGRSFPSTMAPFLTTSFCLDWRRPDGVERSEDYARYVQIVTWFLDTPSPEAPFSVHRMALAGKDLGKDVGQWFGPSTAAGAIKYVALPSMTFESLCQYRTLVHAFPMSGLGVSVATDGTLYQTDIYAASHSSTTAPASSRKFALIWWTRG